jgi:hypothetical protein
MNKRTAFRFAAPFAALGLSLAACSSGDSPGQTGPNDNPDAASGSSTSSGSSSSGGSRGASSSGSGGGGSTGSSGSSGGAGSSSGSSGGAGSSGSGSGGGAGSSGSGSSSGSSSGGGDDGGAEAGAAEGGPGGGATCNLLLGASPTGQWFDGGFLQIVDGSRWECIWLKSHYANLWAMPNDAAWTTAFDPYPGPPHACAQNSMMPERVIYVATGKFATATEWETYFTDIVNNIKAKYPSVQRIELMSLTSAPNNMNCPGVTGATETVIAQVVLDAINAMPAKFPGLVFALPRFDVPQCSDFASNGSAPQYTTAGAMDVAKMFGDYYQAHP